MSQEQEWAQALLKARQTANQIRTSVQTQREDILIKQLNEQIDYYKVKFLEALDKNNMSQTRTLAEKLVSTHARITALLIKKEKDRGATDESPVIADYLTKYFADCRKLLRFLPEA